jgi:hypothetical protein
VQASPPSPRTTSRRRQRMATAFLPEADNHELKFRQMTSFDRSMV